MLPSLRGLRRSRGFLLTAVLVLALGMGVNLILFNAAFALLWRPLGFPQPEGLVTLYNGNGKSAPTRVVTGFAAAALRDQAPGISDIGVTGSRQAMTLYIGNESLDLPAAAVNSGYFHALGLRPLAGRFFGEEEDRGEHQEARAVLTEAAWRGSFGADPSVVGRMLPFQAGAQRREVRILGVVPGAATLPFAPDAQILLPVAWLHAGIRNNSGDAQYRVLLRLKPGPSLDQASAQIDATLQAMEAKSQFGKGPGHYWVESLRTALAPVNRTTIFLLYGASCLLLFLTCANVASLFVARAMGRAQDTAVRLALGATRGRILLANFQEALVVCSAGTALAFGLNRLARPLVLEFLPALRTTGPELLATGWVLLGVGALLCLAISAVVSLQPVPAALSQGGRSEVHTTSRWRAALVAAQVALVLTLLTVGGLMGRSLMLALRSDPGYDPRGVMAFRASIPAPPNAILSAGSDLARVLATVPGVQGAAFASESPVGGSMATMTGAGSGDAVPTEPAIGTRLIGSHYFETLGARLAAGRTFSEEEVQRSALVAILNESAARVLFGAGDPLGRTIHSGLGNRKSVVVGVVRDIRHSALDRAGAPMVYIPCLPGFAGSLNFMVRTSAAPAAFFSVVKSRVMVWNSGVRLRDFEPLEERVEATVRDRVHSGALVACFALLGLMVSSVGLYGTLAMQIEQRKREIGVRMALGATVGAVVTMVLRQGARMVAYGTAAGLAGSLAAAQWVRHELYGVDPLDGPAFALALVLLSAAAMAACALPALRATRVDPVEALKQVY